MSASVRKVKAWIEKHAAIIDPDTKAQLQRELEIQVKKAVVPTKRKKVRA
jgi:hypothetical protein